MESPAARSYSRLEDPNQVFGASIFSSDSAALISSDNDRAIHVWDLRQIRAELAEMGLDWDAPGYPEAEVTSSLPLTVRLNLEIPSWTVRQRLVSVAFGLPCTAFDFEAYLSEAKPTAARKSAKSPGRLQYGPGSRAANHKIRSEALSSRADYWAVDDLGSGKRDLQQISELDIPLPEELQVLLLFSAITWLGSTRQPGEET